MILHRTPRALLLSAFAFGAGLHLAAADLLVGDFDHISRYRDDGSLVNAGFITGLVRVQGLLVDGTNIYVSEAGLQRVGKYQFDGTVVNAGFIPGISDPIGLAAAGGLLFVANQSTGSVGSYVLATGATANAALITGLETPVGALALNGALYLSSFDGDRVTRHALSGQVQDTLTGLAGPTGLALSPSGNLLVANLNAGTVGEYSLGTLDAVAPARITGLSNPTGIASVGGNIAVVNNGTGSVLLYSAAGTLLNASFITGLQSPNVIVRLPQVTPYPQPRVTVKGRRTLATTRAARPITGRQTGASSVEVKVGRAAARPVPLRGATWRTVAKLRPGRNRVTVRGYAPDRTASRPVTITIVRKSRG